MGGLFFHRGSHLGGPLPHRVDGEAENLIGFCVDGADVMSDEAVPVELKAGEVTWNCTIRRDDLDGMGKGCGKDGRMEKGEGFFENFEKLEISIYDCESGVWCRIISCWYVKVVVVVVVVVVVLVVLVVDEDDGLHPFAME